MTLTYKSGPRISLNSLIKLQNQKITSLAQGNPQNAYKAKVNGSAPPLYALL